VTDTMIRLLIDAALPGTAEASQRPLFPAQGDFARAVKRFGARREAGRVPAEVILHLYAYELVERLRDAIAGGEARGDVTFTLPLWPPALFDAAGLEAHAARELLSILPPFAAVAFTSRAPAAVMEAVRAHAGGVPIDLEVYEARLRAAASAGGWHEVEAALVPPVVDAAAGSSTRAPAIAQTTVSAVLWRDGKILLERRPPDAKVTPGLWDTPGGHVDGEEDAESALRREMREELGIAIAALAERVEQQAFEPPHGLPYRHFIYFVPTWEGEAAAREGQAVQWFTLAEIFALDALNPLAASALREMQARGLLPLA
jgi:8-oxo-dGTP diphosphatase